MLIKSFVIAAVAAALVSTSAFAAEDIVKPEATPPPAAGPTMAAAEAFCGDPTGKADELAKLYMAKAGLKQVDKSAEFLTYADDEKNPTVMYNFTTDKSPAHPSAVCRKFVKEGDQVGLKYNVVCGAAENACAKLTNDFNVLIARMQATVDGQIKSSGK